MADKSAFGLPMGETPEDDPFADAPEVEAAEPSPAVEEDTASTADPLAPPPEPEEVEAEPEPELEPVMAETPEPEPEVEGTPYEGRYGDKYKTIEQMEEAHRNALALAQRQAERAKATEEQLQQATAYLQALDQYFAEQERQAKAATETETITKQATELGLDEETLRIAREIAAKEAEERMVPLQQQFALQQQQAQLAATEAATTQQINAFRVAHADVAPETEQVMVEVFNELGLDPTVGENYPIALEMAQNDELRSVLRANPTYVDSDDGLALARRLAGIHPVTKAPEPRDLTEARRKATVESGSSGAAPVGEEKPHDDWDDVLKVAQNSRKKSAFGV